MSHWTLDVFKKYDDYKDPMRGSRSRKASSFIGIVLTDADQEGGGGSNSYHDDAYSPTSSSSAAAAAAARTQPPPAKFKIDGFDHSPNIEVKRSPDPPSLIPFVVVAPDDSDQLNPDQGILAGGIAEGRSINSFTEVCVNTCSKFYSKQKPKKPSLFKLEKVAKSPKNRPFLYFSLCKVKCQVCRLYVCIFLYIV